MLIIQQLNNSTNLDRPIATVGDFDAYPGSSSVDCDATLRHDDRPWKLLSRIIAFLNNREKVLTRYRKERTIKSCRQVAVVTRNRIVHGNKEYASRYYLVRRSVARKEVIYAHPSSKVPST